MHSPILLKNISVQFQHKSCFKNFSAVIHPGDHIGIIGPNGSGKSTLLNLIQGNIELSSGQVIIPDDVAFGYVPQIIQDFYDKSGGQRFNHALTSVLAQQPNVLCLDEPTNHLDMRNHKNLLRMLAHYPETLIVVSHDVELLRTCVNQVWAIEEGKVTIFNGSYDDYIRERSLVLRQRHATVEQLKKEKRKVREAAQAERQRAASRKRANIYEHDTLIKNRMKETASVTSSKKDKKLTATQQRIDSALAGTSIPETITVDFQLNPAEVANKIMVSIEQGSCGYQGNLVLTDINLQVAAQEHVVIAGDNGSGKSTLFKALMQLPEVVRDGTWIMPAQQDIGYLDQHYSQLDPGNSVFQTIEQAVSGWHINDIRRHLNNFLFRKNEEVQALVATLSGGEKARLSLALIAAQNPKLILLDEITNNLDLAAREQVIQVLRAYPGAMMIISHDLDFLEQIKIDSWYCIEGGRLMICNDLEQ